MQTFLPYSNFVLSAKCLDYRRLGKQRVEGFQILQTILYGSKWRNHPAVKMWVGYEEALRYYVNIMIIEWKSRGYKNNMELFSISEPIVYPWWVDNEDFHRSHRSRLIVKDPEFYGPLFPEDLNFNDGNYYWPDNDTRTFRIIIRN